MLTSPSKALLIRALFLRPVQAPWKLESVDTKQTELVVRVVVVVELDTRNSLPSLSEPGALVLAAAAMQREATRNNFILSTNRIYYSLFVFND